MSKSIVLALLIGMCSPIFAASPEASPLERLSVLEIKLSRLEETHKNLQKTVSKLEKKVNATTVRLNKLKGSYFNNTGY